MAQQPSRPEIVYSCYHQVSRGGEQFIQDHIFSYQVSGTLFINDGNKEHVFAPGDFRFVKRNQLAKYLKQPPDGGEFKSVSITIDQDTLRNLNIEQGYTVNKDHTIESIIQLPSHPLYKGYMDSIMAYEHLLPEENKDLLSL